MSFEAEYSLFPMPMTIEKTLLPFLAFSLVVDFVLACFRVCWLLSVAVVAAVLVVGVIVVVSVCVSVCVDISLRERGLIR